MLSDWNEEPLEDDYKWHGSTVRMLVIYLTMASSPFAFKYLASSMGFWWFLATLPGFCLWAFLFYYNIKQWRKKHLSKT